MEEIQRINNLGGGKYSVLIGHKTYTVVTKLDEARFRRAAEIAISVSDGFPKNLSQDNILFLSLLSMAKGMEEISKKVDAIADKFSNAKNMMNEEMF